MSVSARKERLIWLSHLSDSELASAATSPPTTVTPTTRSTWDRRDARITNFRDGSVAFEQLDVEVPASWSFNATNILAQKYFRGTLGTAERETSLKQVVDRIVDTDHRSGASSATTSSTRRRPSRSAPSSSTCSITQKAAFNSPVWFNIGVKGVPQQGSACFILAVEDSMRSILNWYTEEGIIFKGGSGAGVNLSKIRSSAEMLEGGGTASGPVSFMRGADASAGTIKSGGKTRRAAKMVILDADHPDIEEFIWCKANEENKARVLRDNGFDMDLDGKDIHSIQYQNANNSVRVSDDFMEAVIADGDWNLNAATRRSRRADREGPRTLAPDRSRRVGVRRPRPAVRHDDQQVAHVVQHRPHQRLEPVLGVHAHRQLRVQPREPQPDEVPASTTAVSTSTPSSTRSRCSSAPRRSSSAPPTTRPRRSRENSRKFRQLGLGYANLGALLMASGLAYDSDEGRAWAAAITALMTGHAYATSARTAGRMGPHEGYEENAEPMLNVLRMHRDASYQIDAALAPEEILQAAQHAWEDAVDLGSAPRRAQRPGLGARTDRHHRTA